LTIVIIICTCISFYRYNDLYYDDVVYTRIENKNYNSNKNFIQKFILPTTYQSQSTYILKPQINQVDKFKILNRNCTHIDAVYTWVNGSDPNHIEKRKNAGINKDGSQDNRYRDYGSLKYSLRSIVKYAPWIKNIWIITDSQIPDFFDTSIDSKVKFIFHESFFHNISHLPTFNSVSIESNFYNLPEEVSNCFLYFNDDVFLKESVEPNEFFYGDGEQYLFETLLEVGPRLYRQYDQLDDYIRALILNGRLMDEVFNTRGVYRRKADHGVQVFDRKILLKMEELVGPELDLSSSHKQRDINDIQISFIYNQFAKKFQNGFTPKRNFNFYGALASDLYSLKTTLMKALRSSAKVVCLNDGLDSTNVNQYELSLWTITNFFDTLFPHPAPWEISTPYTVPLPQVINSFNTN